MLSDFYSAEIADHQTQLALQSLYAQLRALLAVSFNDDGTLIPAVPSVGIVPIGTILSYGGATVPAKWLLCDGSQVNRVTYGSLFAILGTTYGAGDGSTTFNLPDLRQRFPLGKAAAGTGGTLGSTGGAIDHTHTGTAHTHTLTAAGTNTTGAHTHSGSTGAEASHTHPYSGTTDNADAGSTVTGNFGANYFTSQSTHVHTYSGTTSAGSSHAHSIGSDGNHAHTLTGSTDSSGAGATGPENPPFQVVNFIVLAGV